MNVHVREDPRVFLTFIVHMWRDTEHFWGKATRAEALETFYLCEKRSGQVIFSHRALARALSWLKARGFVA